MIDVRFKTIEPLLFCVVLEWAHLFCQVDRFAIAPQVSAMVSAGETPAFGIFVAGRNQEVVFDPGANRVSIEFADEGGVVRGGTSVAVQTLGIPVQESSTDLIVTSFDTGQASCVTELDYFIV